MARDNSNVYAWPRDIKSRAVVLLLHIHHIHSGPPPPLLLVFVMLKDTVCIIHILFSKKILRNK